MLSKEAERSSCSMGGEEDGTEVVCSEEGQLNRNGKSLARQPTTGGWRAGRIGWQLITKTYDHFDLPLFIYPSSSPKRTTDWLVSLCSDLVIGYCLPQTVSTNGKWEKKLPPVRIRWIF